MNYYNENCVKYGFSDSSVLMMSKHKDINLEVFIFQIKQKRI